MTIETKSLLACVEPRLKKYDARNAPMKKKKLLLCTRCRFLSWVSIFQLGCLILTRGSPFYKNEILYHCTCYCLFFMLWILSLVFHRSKDCHRAIFFYKLWSKNPIIIYIPALCFQDGWTTHPKVHRLCLSYHLLLLTYFHPSGKKKLEPSEIGDPPCNGRPFLTAIIR